MFRILIAEDQPLTRKTIETLFANYFPDAEIRSVDDGASARRVLENWRDEGVLLDVAILDIKIPEARGTNAEVNALCNAVREFQKSALVLHITAYYKDADVKEHLATYHSDDVSNPARIVSKEDKQWEDIVLRMLANYRVARKLDDYSNRPSRFGRSLRPSGWRNQSSTARQASLTNDISRYWKLLEPSLQERIRQDFDVRDDKKPVLVGLGGRS